MIPSFSPYMLMLTGMSVTLWMWMLFSTKHFLADYVLQSDWMVQNKCKFFHPAGWTHATVHGLCSLPVWAILFWVIPLEIELVEIALWFGVIFPAEVIVRFLNDFGEKNLIRLVPKRFRWWCIGLNQYVDNVIYVLMCVAWWILIVHNYPSTTLRFVGLT